uniref:DUF4236 domain-containing protein n=1 Tax=Knipowitschia caucasica TaxID=637954 RepID=A0AAV2K0Z7_KNICA
MSALSQSVRFAGSKYAIRYQGDLSSSVSLKLNWDSKHIPSSVMNNSVRLLGMRAAVGVRQGGYGLTLRRRLPAGLAVRNIV